MRHTPLTFAREKERMGEAGRVAKGWGWGRGEREKGAGETEGGTGRGAWKGG